jgi:ABC-type ATPase involved in cell division
VQGGGDVKVAVCNRCSDFNSYRAARVKSLFNAESGCNFNLDADLAIDDADWKVGLIVGPSGSGKTSVGRQLFGPDALYEPAGWAADKPIVDCIAPKGDFDAVTGALAAVGLGTVPAWLRPYPVLSNGEKFRADLAKIIAEAPARVVVDEFTSVVDRQIARFGALAFQKAWRRTKGQAVLLSCHYDVIDWLEPDWVFDTAKGEFARGSLWRRPRFELEVWQTDGRYWPLFEPHHYLKLPRMVAPSYYVGTVEGEPVCHLAVSPRLDINHVRACRLVVMPEWQGAGVGLRFLNDVCQRQLDGGNKWGRKCRTLFHTSHPGLCTALRRDPKWRQTSAKLYGANKKNSGRTIRASNTCIAGTGYGGHFRAVQGFRYVGQPAAAAA